MDEKSAPAYEKGRYGIFPGSWFFCLRFANDTFATLATTMEQYIHGRSRDLVAQVCIKFIGVMFANLDKIALTKPKYAHITLISTLDSLLDYTLVPVSNHKHHLKLFITFVLYQKAISSIKFNGDDDDPLHTLQNTLPFEETVRCEDELATQVMDLEGETQLLKLAGETQVESSCMGHNRGWEAITSALSHACIEINTCNAALSNAADKS
nr:exocyst complex, component EXOC1 [Tanacetum cinerariifolium]